MASIYTHFQSENKINQEVVTHTFNPSRSRWISLSSRPTWFTEQFQDNQGYTEKPSLKPTTTKRGRKGERKREQDK